MSEHVCVHGIVGDGSCTAYSVRTPEEMPYLSLCEKHGNPTTSFNFGQWCCPDCIEERLSEARKVAQIFIGECRSKHLLHPCEPDIDPDYTVPISLSIGEMRALIKSVLPGEEVEAMELAAVRKVEREE